MRVASREVYQYDTGCITWHFRNGKKQAQTTFTYAMGMKENGSNVVGKFEENGWSVVEKRQKFVGKL